jgi:hypothetical protein
MAEQNPSFLRKVVRFVSNPTTDWTDLNSRQEDTKELDLEKTELKAMIERKRRNDFVRKREFDMLRKIRREGLSPEQLAALGSSSRLDDSEARADSRHTRDGSVKEKIDQIEQQMVGDTASGSGRRALGDTAGDGRGTRSADSTRGAAPASGAPGMGFEFDKTTPARPAFQDSDGFGLAAGPAGPAASPAVAPSAASRAGLPPAADLRARASAAAAPAPVQMGSGLPPLAPLTSVSFAPTMVPAMEGSGARPGASPGSASTLSGASDFGNPFAVEVSEVMHDPELDEAVIAFANADFAQCESALRNLTGSGGARAQHAETWLVLFDLYRATGLQQQFESLAVEYAQQFGWSAPQWYSLPKLVAEALADDPVLATTAKASSNDVGWQAPDILDIDAVARLRSQTLQMPLPWVFDWNALRLIDAEAAMQLSSLFRLWAGQALEMRWIGGERLFQILQESAPTGMRDADPAFWQTRLDALRLANRADQFDEAAIDYCVTYEVSPPSWEPARCTVHIGGGPQSTRQPAMSAISDVSTSFQESSLIEDAGGGIEVAHVELSGQLVGDISMTLAKLSGQLGRASIASVSCARLIRVDFIAAGDLLNWVLSKKGESRSVQFVDAHRLVALFFGAMGINEHAKVQVRKV